MVRVRRQRRRRRPHTVPGDEPNLTEVNTEEDNYVGWNPGDDVNADVAIKSLFTGPSNFISHYEAQNKFPRRYFACLHVLCTSNIQLLENSKSLALAAAWARKDYPMANFLLKIPNEMFHIKEVLRAITMLDLRREGRAQEKLLRRLEAQGCKKKKKLAALKSRIGTLKAQALGAGSLSGALSRHVKQWVKTIPVERLQFFAMHFPSEPWKNLADLIHLNPERDMPQCPWFLPFCFGKQPMPDTPASQQLSDLTEDNISQVILNNKDVDYTVARKFRDHLTDLAKERICRYSKIETVLWYYEELDCTSIDVVLHERLSKGEEVNLPYGKFLERILYFRNSAVQKEYLKFLIAEAEKKAKKISFNLEPPVVVMGDKSGSMDVAVRTSNIIASSLTSLTDAQLVFFDAENVIPSLIPSNVEEVLRLCDEVKACGGTTPAASLYPYYEKKKVVKTFFVVTDEEENGAYMNESFASLFKKYNEEVYPASLVFISFLSQNDFGRMMTQLKEIAPDIKPLQFKLSEQRPDLTKLDAIYAMLSFNGEEFSKKVDVIEENFAKEDIPHVLSKLDAINF